MWLQMESENNEENIDISDTQQLQPIDEEDKQTVHQNTETNKNLPEHEPVLDNIGDEEEQEFDFVVITQWSWRACLTSRYGIVALYIFLTLILISSFLVLVIVITMVCVPFHRAYGFIETECEVIGAHIHPTPSLCSCGKGCDSHYPCLVVRVGYTDLHGDQHNTTLHDNEVALGKRCTYYPSCKSSHAENIGRVHAYRVQYGSPADNFLCFYNPHVFSQVIRTQRFHVRHVVHGVLWSSLFLLMSAILLVITIWKRKCH